MAWLRRLGATLCGTSWTGTGIATHEGALGVSRVLSARYDSLVIVAIGKTHIHWLDLGRARSSRLDTLGKCGYSVASIVGLDGNAYIVRRGEVAGPTLTAGTLERQSARGAEVQGNLAPLHEVGICRVDIAPETENPSVCAAGRCRSSPLIRWLLALPCADDSRLEWVERLEPFIPKAMKRTRGIVTAPACSVASVPQLVALYRLAVRHDAQRTGPFQIAFVCAAERVAAFADPWAMGALPAMIDDLKTDPDWIGSVVRSPTACDLKHLARALILGGGANAPFLGRIATGTVLEATRAAIAHRGAIMQTVLAHAPLPAAIARVVCEFVHSLPDLAADVLDVPIPPPDVTPRSTYHNGLFTHLIRGPHGGAIRNAAILTYHDGRLARVCLTISPTGEETLTHCPARDAPGVFVVSATGESDVTEHQLDDWSEPRGLVIRDHLDSLFDDSLDNRILFITRRLKQAFPARDSPIAGGARADDWAEQCRAVARIVRRFGADAVATAVAAAVSHIDHGVNCKSGSCGHDGAFAAALAAGVPPNHPRFSQLPWFRVRNALAYAHTD